MGIRFFRGQKTKFEHEHRQLKEIVEVLRKEYQKEPVYLLTNVLVANGQIDCVILTRKGPIILELKAFKGEIRGMENGSWEVTTRDGPIPLPNLFLQAKIHRQDFIDRLIPICREQFPHIGENNLRRTGSWLYFCRGATYSEGQVDFRRVKWFRIVTQETLIEKMRFADSGYTLRLIDMDAIVSGLRLQEYSFESDRPVVPEPVASPKKIVITRGMVIAAVILVFVIGILLLVMFVPGSRVAIANTYHGIAAISGSFIQSLSKETFKSESTPDDSRQALVYLNGIRIIKGIAPVAHDDRAFQLARIRAEDMARYGYLNYSNPSTGTSAESLRTQFGIDVNDTVVETAYGQWSGYTLGIERQAIDSWFSDNGNSRRLLSAYDGGAIACSQGYCAFIGVIAAPAGNATASENITS